MKSLKSQLFGICGVYKIVCNKNGLSYIGSSHNIYRRWVSHLVELNKNRHDNPKLQNAYNKYGKECFYIELVETCNADILLDREQYYLDTLKPYKLNGYNINTDATCGPYMGISLSLISPDGLLCTAKSAHEFVIKYDLPQKAIGPLCRLRDRKKLSYKGWSHPDNIIQKRQLRGPDGKIYNIQYTNEHAQKYKLSEQCLCYVLKGKQKSHKGWSLP